MVFFMLCPLDTFICSLLKFGLVVVNNTYCVTHSGCGRVHTLH